MPRGIPNVKNPEPPVRPGSNEELLNVLKGVADAVGEVSKSVDLLSKRVTKIEDGGRNAFKEGAKQEDIATAHAMREGIDPKIDAIVNELLGEDFGVQILPRGDQPGFRFTVIVPQRLSDNITETRPVRDPKDPVQYKKDSLGNVIMENYIREDRRSRNISSHDSYDAIRQHCERVRANIVATFTKMQKPLPAFKVK